MKGVQTMDDNIIELGTDYSTVETVITRLHRNMDKIKSVTAIIEWRDGSSAVYHEKKLTRDMTYDALVLQNYLLNDMLERT